MIASKRKLIKMEIKIYLESLKALARLIWCKTSLLLPRKSKIPPAPIYLNYSIWGYNQNTMTNSNCPKILWSYWSGEKSPCAEACKKSWEKHASDFTIKVLNPKTIREHLPDFPDLPEEIPTQQFSDLVRLMLLERYGGIWIDHSTIITQPLDWVIDLLKKTHSEAVAFYNEFPDEYHSNPNRPIIENGFIAAHPKSKFIGDWRSRYQECIKNSDYKNFFRAQKNFDDLTCNFVNKDKDYIDYFVCYIAAQDVMHHPEKYRLTLINAEDEYFFTYYKLCPPRNKRRYAEELLLTKEQNYPLPRLIKIPGGHRNRIDEYIRHDCYHNQSLLGLYLQ